MTERDDLAAAIERGKRHVAWVMTTLDPQRRCNSCGQPWPCDTYLLAAEVERLREARDLADTCALMQAHRAFWLNHVLTQAGITVPQFVEDALIETFDGCWDDDGNIVRPLPADKLRASEIPTTDTPAERDEE